MKRLFLLIVLLGQQVNPVFGQGIRSITDTLQKPVRNLVQAITPDTYVGRQIRVGSGGGFTGFTTTYYLFDNGKLFRRRSRDTTFAFIGQQTMAQTKRLFSSVERTCKIKKTKFDHPGNRYTFVQWRKGKQSYKVSWGMPGYSVPTTYLKFVHSFMAIVPAASSSK